MRFLVFAAIAATLPLGAMAEDDSPEVTAMKARQGYFKLLGANMEVLAGMAKGEIPYDEERAAMHASNIETLSQYNLGFHFPEGTSSDDLEGSGALPKIWTELDGVVAKHADLAKAATGAGDAVRGGEGNVGPVVQALGGTCKACHDNYRKK